MKLITWNIQWGLGVDGHFDLARLVEHARSMADFDLLCLQEVADNFPDLKGSSGENQFAEFARMLPGYTAIEGPGVDVPDGQGRRRRFGNMLLSRYPVGRVLRHSLPWISDGTRSMPRLLIDAVVAAPWGPVRVMTTHLEYFSEHHRAVQVEAIRRALADGQARAGLTPTKGPGPFASTEEAASAILTADFNITPDDRLYGMLAAAGDDGTPGLVDAWSALNPGQPHPISFCLYDQTYKPPHCCDFVFLTPDLRRRLRRVSYDTDTQFSDHQPVLVELED